jgi:hypothetical protein
VGNTIINNGKSKVERCACVKCRSCGMYFPSEETRLVPPPGEPNFDGNTKQYCRTCQKTLRPSHHHLHISFAPPQTNNLTTYKTVGYLLYCGTVVVGVPHKLVIAAWSPGGYSGKVRIYDVTNARTIVETEDIMLTLPGIFEQPDCHNCTEDKALWEIQIRSNINGKQFVCAQVGVLW